MQHDRTLELLREIAAKDPRVKVLAYSRNFGAEKSSFTALRYARGDACVGITADLQEPPSLIPKMVALWEQGYDVVYGVYHNRRETWLNAVSATSIISSSIESLRRLCRTTSAGSPY